MRILVLTKRQYTGKDLLDDRFGRLFEIPKSLALLGHQVCGLALSYRQRPDICLSAEATGGVVWETMNALPFSPIGAARHLKRIRARCDSFRPDVVWASSDAWHAMAARQVCLSLGIPYVVDLYDNYESFGLSKPPGIIPFFRRACRTADGLTLISGTLSEYVRSRYALPPDMPNLHLGNAVDTALFSPIDKQQARKYLGLPANAVLIGTAGALDNGRGIVTLLKACEKLVETMPSIRLVLAGPHDGTLDHFRHLPIDYLGILPPTKTPLFWNALDLAIIQNRDSDFGRYCYPQKLQEIVACNVPLVASSVGEVKEILRDSPECLVAPDSPDLLAERIAAQVKRKILVHRSEIRTWRDRAQELSRFLEEVVARSGISRQGIGDKRAG